MQSYSPILKPNFYLSFCEAEGVGNFNSPPARQVAVVVELLLQFQGLVARVRLPRPLLFVAEFSRGCKTQNRRFR